MKHKNNHGRPVKYTDDDLLAIAIHHMQSGEVIGQTARATGVSSTTVRKAWLKYGQSLVDMGYSTDAD